MAHIPKTPDTCVYCKALGTAENPLYDGPVYGDPFSDEPDDENYCYCEHCSNRGGLSTKDAHRFFSCCTVCDREFWEYSDEYVLEADDPRNPCGDTACLRCIKEKTNDNTSPAIKVITSTSETQGQRGNDFCHTPDGEIVRFGLECDGETIDGSCGCRRSMIGIDCLKGTTTVTVSESQISYETFCDKIRKSYLNSWGKLDKAELFDLEDAITAEIDDLLNIAASFPVGTVLEKRGNGLVARPNNY